MEQGTTNCNRKGCGNIRHRCNPREARTGWSSAIGRLIPLDAVGEFVGVVGATGEMFGQQFAGAFDTLHNAFGELGPAEMFGHGAGQFLPEDFTTTGMHAGVADDGEFARTGREVDQDRVAVAGFRHAEVRELFLRRRHGVDNVLVADEDAEFPGSFLFRGTDGRNNFRLAQ